MSDPGTVGGPAVGGLTVGIVGTGRLGRSVAEACARAGVPVVLTADRRGRRGDAVPTVLVDASAAGAADQVHDYCAEHRVALVECVSDLTSSQWSRLERLAAQVAVVRAPNLAVGNYLQSRLAAHLAELQSRLAGAGILAATAETSVAERHPTTKAHRPSATAVALAEGWERAAGTPVADVASERGGLPVSDHQLLWSWPAETLLLRHSVQALDAAAGGALAAARWAAGQPAGLYLLHSVFDDLIDRGVGAQLGAAA